MMKQDDGHLTKEEVQAIEARAVRPVDDYLSYADVFKPKLLSNPDAEQGGYRVLERTGKAGIVRRGANYKKLKVNGSSVTYDISEVGIGYDLPKVDIKLAKSFNRPLNLEYVDSAIRVAHEKINEMVYRGDTEFGEYPGVLSLTGVTAYSGTDLDTADLNLYDEFVNMFNSLPSKFRKRKYNLVLADAEYKKFLTIGNAYKDLSWKQMIESNYSNVKVILDDEIAAGNELAGGGTIAAGTAMLIPHDDDLCRLPIGYVVKSVVDKESVSNSFKKNIEGRSEGRYGPIEAPHPTSLIKITGW